LHGYVPSLDYVVSDTEAFLEKIRSENPGVPCFLFGHSTGGAVVLKVPNIVPLKLSLRFCCLQCPDLWSTLCYIGSFISLY
jgi:pimeloyl-ACP methyl ester carboxylesterase